MRVLDMAERTVALTDARGPRVCATDAAGR